jgi:hypothetical protein
MFSYNNIENCPGGSAPAVFSLAALLQFWLILNYFSTKNNI